MYTYIKNSIEDYYITLEEELPNELYEIGTTFQDFENGKWILLNENQLSFKEENPTASVEEVFNMELNVVEPDEPETPENPEEPTEPETPVDTEEPVEPSEPEEQVRTLGDAKLEMSNRIDEYDKSSAVNSFSINGQNMWLNVAERQQLATQISANKQIGREVMSRWFNGIEFTFPIYMWEYMLMMLEVYAGDAINVTERHKANINALDTIEAIDNYDYTTGYPDKLIFGDPGESTNENEQSQTENGQINNDEQIEGGETNDEEETPQDGSDNIENQLNEDLDELDNDSEESDEIIEEPEEK